MTNFNFLSKSSSQSCGHSSVTLASTVGSPSVRRRSTMLKLLSVLVLVLTFGVGQMWGVENETLSCSAGTVSNNQMSFSTTHFTVVHAKGTDNNFASYSPWRVYTNNTVTISAKTGVSKITKLEITCSSNAYASVIAANACTVTTTGSGTITVTKGSSSTVGTITLGGTGSATSVSIKPGAQTRWSSIKIYYEAASSGCSNKVTLATGNPTNGTISFSPTGPVETCNSSVDVTMTITPNAGYYLSAYSKTGVNTSNTPSITTGTSATSAQTPTLTFAKDANGTYTASATFTAFVDHFIDDVQSTTGYTGTGMAKSGDYSTSKPSILDKTVATSGTCEQQHYHFCGWVTADYRDNPHGHLATINGTATGTTYYAVWAKQGTGAGSFDGEHNGTYKIYATSGTTDYYATNTISSNSLTTTTTAADAQEYTFTKSGDYWTISYKSGNTTYYLNASSSSNMGTFATATGTYTSWKIVSQGSGVWRLWSASTNQGANAYNYRAMMLNSSYKFKNYCPSSDYEDCKIGGSIAYADSITVCCQPLGSINGSFF